MYGIEVVTPAASLPLSAADLRERLRLNSSAEDSLLAKFIQTAVDRFEAATSRPVLSTVYRQHVNRWPSPLVLGRGGVTAVGSVVTYTAAGAESTITGWRAVLKVVPACIVFPDGSPACSFTPAGYVQFTAGWANAAAVPAEVVTAIALLAGHYYECREAFRGDDLAATPAGWDAITRHYKLGLTGDWGQ